MVETSFDELTESQIALRLQRLEASVAALQNTELVEDRIVDHVTRRLKRDAAKSTPEVATDAPQPESLSEPVAEVELPVAPPKTTWLLAEFWGEIRTYGRLLFDHRYRVSLLGWVGPLAIALAYLVALLVIGGWFIVGGVFERVIDVILVVLLYKICLREVHRYRAQYPGR